MEIGSIGSSGGVSDPMGLNSEKQTINWNENEFLKLPESKTENRNVRVPVFENNPFNPLVNHPKIQQVFGKILANMGNGGADHGKGRGDQKVRL